LLRLSTLGRHLLLRFPPNAGHLIANPTLPSVRDAQDPEGLISNPSSLRCMLKEHGQLGMLRQVEAEVGPDPVR